MFAFNIIIDIHNNPMKKEYYHHHCRERRLRLREFTWAVQGLQVVSRRAWILIKGIWTPKAVSSPFSYILRVQPDTSWLCFPFMEFPSRGSFIHTISSALWGDILYLRWGTTVRSSNKKNLKVKHLILQEQTVRLYSGAVEKNPLTKTPPVKFL